MATFSKKVMGKEVGNASVYAKPHTGSLDGVDISNSGYSTRKGSNANDVNMSVGNIYREAPLGPKIAGIKTRGNGCATKGVMARGPMA